MGFPKIEAAMKPAYRLLSKSKLFATLRLALPELKRKEFDQYWEESRNEVAELFKRPSQPRKGARAGRITGPPGAFQIDVAVMKTYEEQDPEDPDKTRLVQLKKYNGKRYLYLACVDILSRKAYCYVLDGNSVADVLKGYKRFLADVGERLSGQPVLASHSSKRPYTVPSWVQGDDFFSAREFRRFNAEVGIPVSTDVAKDDHIRGTSGDKLGIVDRALRTLKKLLYVRIESNKRDPGLSVKETYNWTAWLQEIVDLYNDTPHDGLGGRTPADMWNDREAQTERWHADIEHNRERTKQIAERFQAGMYARRLLSKSQFAKEGASMSLEVYKVTGLKGQKVLVEDAATGKPYSRPLKPSELAQVDGVGAQAGNLPARGERGPGPRERPANARAARRMRKEGLPEPAQEAEQAPRTVADMVKKGQIMVIDVEGAPASSYRLELEKDGRTCYVECCLVTQVTKTLVSFRAYEAVGTGRDLGGKLRLDKKQAYNLHGNQLKMVASVLYVGSAPRVRSDGTSSLPKKAVEEVRREYAFE